MIDFAVISATIGVLSTISAFVFALATHRRNRSKDDMQGGKEMGVILTELGYMRAQLDDLIKKQDRQNEKQSEQHLALSNRITAVEESAKQAHKRIDGLFKDGAI